MNNNLALLLYDGMERYSEAERVFVEFLQKYRSVLGESRPDTSGSAG
jgi:hypothetical protein